MTALAPTPLALPALTPRDVERFWASADVGALSACWPWLGATRTGYGRFKVGRTNYSAHRISYELLVGPIPKGMTLDHGEHCSNRSCINPAHVEVVTLGENTARSNARRTGPRGWGCAHPRTPENVYTRPSGHEECRRCRSRARGRYRAGGRARP